jgi:hypothetical protein
VENRLLEKNGIATHILIKTGISPSGERQQPFLECQWIACRRKPA